MKTIDRTDQAAAFELECQRSYASEEGWLLSSSYGKRGNGAGKEASINEAARWLERFSLAGNRSPFIGWQLVRKLSRPRPRIFFIFIDKVT
jgi:hypothetical protein